VTTAIVNETIGERKSSELRSGTINVDGLDIKYVEAGSGDPLIYLHGGDGLRLSLAHRELAEKYRLIAFEVPGFGASLNGEKDKSLCDIAAVMNKAIVKLGIERFSLMGHSLGANLSLWMGIENSKSLDAILLVAPTAIRPDADEYKGMPHQYRPRVDGNDWYRGPTLPSAESNHGKRIEVLNGKPRDPEFEQKMVEISVPVMALFGTSDRVVATTAARIYCELLPKCFAVMVYDAAHEIDLDRPQAVASIAKNFFEHREGFVVNRNDGMVNP
jgi:pimeloyl-ACP methyl ester carboxylesterase